MINDLIAKLEAATEGSRKLDALIHNACIAADEAEEAQFPNPYVHEAEGLHAFVRGGFWHRIPAYTTSLDTAMTLVPEGVDIMFEIEHVMGGPCVYVRVGQGGAIAPARGDSDGSIFVTRMGGTYYKKEGPRIEATWTDALKLLPVAVCTAALKARSQS